MQQIGASLGLATLVPLTLRHADGRVADGILPQSAQTDGHALALRAAGVLAAAAVLVLPLMDKVAFFRPRDAVAEAAHQAAAAAAPANSS
jgi:hypothetical protein